MALTDQTTAGGAAAAARGPLVPGTGAARRRRPSWRLLIPVGTTLVILGLWELFARTGALPEAVPPVTDIINWIGHQGGDASFWTALRQTLWHWFGGLVIGGAVGMALGIAIGMVPVIQRLLNVPLELLRPIPAVVYLPVLILIMGSRSKTATILAAVGAFWPMLFQTIYGVRAIDPQAIETGTVFGLTPGQRLTRIMLPSVAPYLATGVRISSSLALVVAVSTELVGGVPGLGAQLANYSQNAIYPAMYGILFISGVLGLVLNLVLEGIEKRMLHWHISHRAVS